MNYEVGTNDAQPPCVDEAAVRDEIEINVGEDPHRRAGSMSPSFKKISKGGESLSVEPASPEQVKAKKSGSTDCTSPTSVTSSSTMSRMGIHIRPSKSAKTMNSEGETRGLLDDGNGDEDNGIFLPEDTFTLMALAPTNSRSFWLGIGVFFLQMSTLSMLAWDIVVSDSYSLLGIPPMTQPQVRISQFIAIFISVLSQTDIIWSINVLLNGYCTELHVIADEIERNTNETGAIKEVAAKKEFPPLTSEYDAAEAGTKGQGGEPALEAHAENKATAKAGVGVSTVNGPSDNGRKRWQWIIANGCRFVEGLFALTVTFALIMRSETVRDLLLNFTAVEFISNVDNMVFLLGKWRYFGRNIRRMTRHPNMTEDAFVVHGSDISFCNKISVSSNFLVFFITFTLFFFLWLGLSIAQGNGKYLPPSYYVEFGDGDDVSLGFLSGTYHRRIASRGFRTTFSHVTYELANAPHRTWFQYCQEDSSHYWAFAQGSILDARYACQNWIAQSSSMPENLLRPPSSDNMQWYSNKAAKSTERLIYIRIHEGREPGPSCNGKDCDETCKEIISVEKESNLLGADCGSPDINPVFRQLNTKSYRRPVYATETRNGFAILLFTGRRWALLAHHSNNNKPRTSAASRPEINATDIEAFVGALKRRLVDPLKRGWFLQSSKDLTDTDVAGSFTAPTLFSEVVDAGSQKDNGTPNGLMFYRSGNVPPANSGCFYYRKSKIKEAFDSSVGKQIFSCRRSTGSPSPEPSFELTTSADEMGTAQESDPSPEPTWSDWANESEIDGSGGDEWGGDDIGDGSEAMEAVEYSHEGGTEEEQVVNDELLEWHPLDQIVGEETAVPPQLGDAEEGSTSQRPTRKPTRKPSRIPTHKPTHAPTRRPTRAPTESPTPPPIPRTTSPPTLEVCDAFGRACTRGTCAKQNTRGDTYVCCEKMYIPIGWGVEVCQGTLKENEPCPSTFDEDCAGALVCAQKSWVDQIYICCKESYVSWGVEICT